MAFSWYYHGVLARPRNNGTIVAFFARPMRGVWNNGSIMALKGSDNCRKLLPLRGIACWCTQLRRSTHPHPGNLARSVLGPTSPRPPAPALARPFQNNRTITAFHGCSRHYRGILTAFVGPPSPSVTAPDLSAPPAPALARPRPTVPVSKQ
eukprot:5477186-Alexandrium_andersonii.AAC.1